MNVYKVFPFIEALPFIVTIGVMWETLIMNFAYGISASPVLFAAVST